MVKTVESAGSKPMSVFCSADRLRSSKPAPSNRISDNATSLTSNVDRVQRGRFVPTEPRCPSARDNDTRERLGDGPSPKITVVARTIVRAKAKVGASKRTSSRRGRLAGASAVRTSMPHREKQTEDAADDGENQILGQQIGHDAATPSAESRSYCDLAVARSATDQQEIGHVRTRNQQHHGDGGQQHDERQLDAPDRAVVEALHHDGDVGIVAVKIAFEGGSNGRHFTLRRLHGRAVREATDPVQIHAPTTTLFVVVADGHPKTRRSESRSHGAQRPQWATAGHISTVCDSTSGLAPSRSCQKP